MSLREVEEEGEREIFDFFLLAHVPVPIITTFFHSSSTPLGRLAPLDSFLNVKGQTRCKV